MFYVSDRVTCTYGNPATRYDRRIQRNRCHYSYSVQSLLFSRIPNSCSSHYSAPKRIRSEYSVQPYSIYISIHLYSVSCSEQRSEALPVRLWKAPLTVNQTPIRAIGLRKKKGLKKANSRAGHLKLWVARILFA